MASDLWDQYLAVLRASYTAAPGGANFYHDRGEVKTFVERLPQSDRIPLLLTAYERYRETADPSPLADRARLIHLLLFARLKPTDAEACVILGTACALAAGEGDHLQPIQIAERAFRDRAYPSDLFDSARAYRDELARLKSPRTKRARDTVDLLLWHDVRRPSRGCWTARVQRAIAAMNPDEAFAWQWLLRNSHTGKAWADEGRKRLAALGETRFLDRVDAWFHFADQERIRMSAAGGHYLRLLVLYCGLADRMRALPIVRRLTAASWSQRNLRRLGLLA